MVPVRGLHPWVETHDDLHPQIDPCADVRSRGTADDVPCQLPITSSTQPWSSSSCSSSRSASSPPRRSSAPSSSSPSPSPTTSTPSPPPATTSSSSPSSPSPASSIGVASGIAVRMRRGDDGAVLARAGWASAFFWVLGMGSRFAFLDLDQPWRRGVDRQFSAPHSIIGGAAWTDALLGDGGIRGARPVADHGAAPPAAPDDGHSRAGLIAPRDQRDPYACLVPCSLEPAWHRTFLDAPARLDRRFPRSPAGSCSSAGRCSMPITSRHHGRGLVISVLFAAVVARVARVDRPPASDGAMTPELWVMAAAGGLLAGASPDSAASAFVFVAVVAAGCGSSCSARCRSPCLGLVALAAGDAIYHRLGLGLLAYALGFAVCYLAASNSRQSVQRAEQAELLLAQTQRSHEEQLRAARLEESTRIAREIHDVLAHALAGLTIQLEATSSLIEQGAERDDVLARVAARARAGPGGTARDPPGRRRAARGRGGGAGGHRGAGGRVPPERRGAGRADDRRRPGPARRARRPGRAARRPGGAHQRSQARARRDGVGGRPRRRGPRGRDRRGGAGPPDRAGADAGRRPGSSSLAATGGGYGLEGMRERARGAGRNAERRARPATAGASSCGCPRPRGRRETGRERARPGHGGRRPGARPRGPHDPAQRRGRHQAGGRGGRR